MNILICIFEIQNVSYIENPSYPSSYSTTGSCSYTVTRCSTGKFCKIRGNYCDYINFISEFQPAFYNLITISYFILEICQVRLDMFKVVLQQPASATGSCTKTYTTITPGASGNTAYTKPPTLCGTLTDQHCKIS